MNLRTLSGSQGPDGRLNQLTRTIAGSCYALGDAVFA